MAKIRQESNIKRSYLIRLTGALILTLCYGWFAVCSAATRENSVVKAVRAVSPAVVNISSEYEIRKNSNPFSGYGMDPMLEKFFRDFFSPEMERHERRTSLGSGVIIDGIRGLVLTNSHVIDKASTINVTLNDQRQFSATIVGMDPESDLAVLKLQSSQQLPDIQMGDSGDVMIGESVIAIGNPFGFSHTVTTGVISAVKRSIKTGERIFHEFIQTDASINPGNSGGPLLNINGGLIGINTAIYAEAQGIGFAIPINRAKRIVSDLINYGEVVQPWIGMSVHPVDTALAAYLQLQNDSGVIVTSLEPESPAAKAGIQEGDIILSMGGIDLTNLSVYQLQINKISVNQTVSITVNRKGDIHQLKLVTAVYPIDRALDLAAQRLGITVSGLDEQTRARYGIRTANGVLIIKMRKGFHLHRIGVRPGDIIHQIGEARIDNITDFKSAVIKYRNKPTVVMLVQRDDNIYHINMPMRKNNQ